MADNKYAYIVRGDGAHKDFADAMRKTVAPKLVDAGARRLKLTVTDEPPPKSFFPFKRKPGALFCVWGDGSDAFSEILRGSVDRVSGYDVEESTPIDYQRTWPDGEATPTPVTINLLRRKPGLSDEEFIQRWHFGHTPLSFKVHPLWYYVRNVIKRPLWEGSDVCDGIVEEACRTKNDLLSPVRFFKGPLMMIPNMIRVQIDTKGFLDMDEFEIYYAKEYHLKSG